ncbi:unknown [Fusobacterium sp. CAG:439]|nr:unknown [Fusobacterium sp. CAG:439]
MDLNNILSQLGVGSKDTVYLSVTPGVGLELIQLDTSSRTVKNYAYRPLEYNESLRELVDIEAFKNAVTELFAELKINIKSNVVLNLPMVLFGGKELPLLLADDAVTEALTSEVEQSYIFKRYEPVISWIDANNSQSGDMRKLFYSAVQKNTIDDIKNALTELGATLSGVEMSLTSILKALAFSGLAEEQMKENISWNLMLITQSGYSICSMIGKNIVDYYEEPLAIKSFEGDEIYNAINASAQITLMSYPANYLYVISETDMVSAELLSKRLQTDGIVNFWENNSFKKQDALPVSLEVLEETAHKISLEAIGIAVGSNVNMPVKFNFLSGSASEGAIDDPNEPVHVVLGTTEFDISPNAARNVALAAAVVLLIPAIIAFMVVPMVAKQKQTLLDDVNAKLQQTDAEIKRLQEEQNKQNDFDVNAEIKKVLGNNRSKLMAYTALGESVPKKLWVTYFVAKDDGKFDIKGDSSNVEDIYLFFRNMKDSLISTKLRLHKLEMKTESVDEAVTIDPNQPADYEFEITNMTSAELNPPPPPDPNAQQQAQQTDDQKNKGSGLLSKPLLNFGKSSN